MGKLLNKIPKEQFETMRVAAEKEAKAIMEARNAALCVAKAKVDAKANNVNTGGIFSDRLEALIAAALQDGVLTDKERELLKRRAEKEGEDWDEVEMIIEARLEEMRPANSSIIANSINSSAQQTKKEAARSDYQESHEKENGMEKMIMDAKNLLPIIFNMLPSMEICDLSPIAKMGAYSYLEELTKKTSKIELSVAIFKDCVRFFMDSKDDDEAKSKMRQLLNIHFESIAPSVSNVSLLYGDSYELYGDSYEGMMNWKRVKYEELKKANNHRNDSEEARQISNKLWKEYEDIKNAIKGGAGSISEVLRYCSAQREDRTRVEEEAAARKRAEEETARKKAEEAAARKKAEKEAIIKELEKGIAPVEVLNISNGVLKGFVAAKFLSDYDIKTIKIPDSVRLIEDQAFEGCFKLKRITLPDTVKEIGYSAFSGCSELESIQLGKNLERIGVMAFNACKKLCDVLLPDTLKTIGDYAFDGCALNEIIIPDSVEEIGCNAFQNNESLESAVIGKSAKNYFKEGPSYRPNENAIFLKTPNLKTLVFRSEIAEYTGAKTLTNVTFADTVKELGKWAVSDNANLEEIRLPESITKIGYGAFAACENLKSIELSDNITEIEEGAFFKTQLREICFPKELRTIGKLSNGLEKLRKVDFSKVTKLETIPEEFIGDDTPKLRELVLPMGVKNIEECIGGENLDRLFLPPTIEEVEDLHQINLDIYCYAPKIEELGMMIESIEDAEDACTLYVLPEYVESYKAQRAAEGISEDLLVIDVIPEEFRYYYDN